VCCRLAAHRLVLLRQEDGAEASLADLFQELVRARDRSGTFTDRHLLDGGPQLRYRGLEEALLLVVDAEQSLDAGLQGGVIATAVLQVLTLAFGGTDLAGDVEDRFCIEPGHCHGTPRP
jgi:hypothetical protein